MTNVTHFTLHGCVFEAHQDTHGSGDMGGGGSKGGGTAGGGDTGGGKSGNGPCGGSVGGGGGEGSIGGGDGISTKPTSTISSMVSWRDVPGKNSVA